MDFKKTFLLGLRLTLILFCLGFLISFNHFNYDSAGDVKNPCPNFNGRDFLLTGGTGTPSTPLETEIEVLRLNWLCEGGNK